MRWLIRLVAVATIITIAIPASAIAATGGPSFHPWSAPPGATVWVGEDTVEQNFPDAAVCPTVTEFLTTWDGSLITSVTDPRLIRLAGRSTTHRIGNKDYPVFTFIVPDIAPAIYSGYYQCNGGALTHTLATFEVASRSVATPPAATTAGTAPGSGRRSDLLVALWLCALGVSLALRFRRHKSDGVLRHRGRLRL